MPVPDPGALEDHVRYHQGRAARELDLGLVAGTLTAARAHLQLASLHMRRVQDIRADGCRPLLKM